MTAWGGIIVPPCQPVAGTRESDRKSTKCVDWWRGLMACFRCNWKHALRQNCFGVILTDY